MHSPEWFEKRDIDAFLAELGAYVVKPTSGGFGASGTADRIFCWRGHFGAVEVKRPGAKPTALQQKRIREVEAAGGKGFWGTAEKVIPEIKAWITLL